MVARSSKFYYKICLGFCLNTRKHFFFGGFILKAIERAQILLKNGTSDFQNSPPLERLACFYVTISGNFQRFQYFNFEADFLQNEDLF